MNHFERIKKTICLQTEKKSLEKEWKGITEEIATNREACQTHITIIMDDTYVFAHNGCKFRCLLCGSHLEKPSKICIDATDFLKDIYVGGEPKGDSFELIQKMAFLMMQANPKQSAEEIASSLKQWIQDTSVSINSKNKIRI